MDLRLRQLRVIAAVAEECSFTRAAERLRLSQQSVSAFVRDFELRIGSPLFTRTTRSVEPTAVCTALVADIRPALEAIDAALDKAAGRQQRRPLVVAITPSVAYGELSLLLESLEGRLQTEPTFRETWADEIGPGLAEGRFDAAICIEVPSIPRLEIVPWRRHRVDLLVSTAHRFASRDRVAMAELDGSILLIPGQEANPALRHQLADNLESAGAEVEIRNAPRVAGPAPIAVERGEAVTVWLTGMQDRYLPAGLARVPLGDPETWVVSKFITVAREDGPVKREVEGLRAALLRTSNIPAVYSQ